MDRIIPFISSSFAGSLASGGVGGGGGTGEEEFRLGGAGAIGVLLLGDDFNEAGRII